MLVRAVCNSTGSFASVNRPIAGKVGAPGLSPGLVVLAVGTSGCTGF